MRGVATLLVIVLGLLLVLAVFMSGGKNRQRQTTALKPAPIAQAPQEEPKPPAQPAKPQPAPTAIATPAIAAAPANVTGLRARAFTEARVPIIGSIDADSGYKLEADLSAWGASILNVQLTDYSRTVRGEEHYTVLKALPDPETPGGGTLLLPFAAQAITINDQTITLDDVRWELISPTDYRTTLKRREADKSRKVTGRAEYALTIVNDQDKPVVELRRTYVLHPNSYHLQCRQQIINRTDKPLDIRWQQRGFTDIARDAVTYMGDRRTLTAGYYDPEYDTSGTRIYTDGTWIDRGSLLKDSKDSWPREDLDPAAQIVWVAGLNRYFALVTHLHVTEQDERAPPLQSEFVHIGVEDRGALLKPEDRAAYILLQTAKVQLAGGAAHKIDTVLYAGPRHRGIFDNPPNDKLGLSQLIKYQMSEACAFCTFQWLARFLLNFLDFLHTIVRDWGVAIIILVIFVRGLLHPITKKSQVNMMVMQRQMQALQPEIEKLKKKYEGDQQKLQQEQFKLMRERGVSFGGCLGMVPMFLQMPIWIALYAMLYLAIELRHQPAFYGLFQMISGWEFLADLSSPDAFFRFSDTPKHIPFPMLNLLDFSVLNILPLLWTVVMYYQQKLTMPPAATDQQAQQQKMMRIMVFLFPIMLYSAPSGLTLYILASTSASILDSYLVRKHVKEQEASGELLAPKKKKQPRKPKPGGFMDRMQKAMEEAQRRAQDQQNKQGGGGSKRGKKRD